MLSESCIIDEQLPGDDISADSGDQSSGSNVHHHVERKDKSLHPIDLVVSTKVIKSSSAHSHGVEEHSCWDLLSHLFFVVAKHV